jgi:hypothetical protein
MTNLICAGDVGLLALTGPLEIAQFVSNGVAWWPRPVIASLQSAMRLEEQVDGRYLYAPRERGLCPVPRLTCRASITE